MRTLTVFCDAGCETCCRARAWLERQPKHVTMAYLPAGSPLARAVIDWLSSNRQGLAPFRRLLGAP